MGTTLPTRYFTVYRLISSMAVPIPSRNVRKPYNLLALERAAAKALVHRRASLACEPPCQHRVDIRLTASDRATIVDAYQSGRPSHSIATEYGISKGKVLDLLREAGAQPPATRAGSERRTHALAGRRYGVTGGGGTTDAATPTTSGADAWGHR